MSLIVTKSAAGSKSGRKPMSARTKKIIKYTLLYTAMIVVAILIMLPFYYSIVTSFRLEYDLQRAPVRAFPESLTFVNYKNFLKQMSNYRTPLGKVLTNTLVMVFSIIAGQLLTCSLAAYSLSRLNYGGKKIIMKIFYMSMMIPGVATLIPSYSVVSTLKLTNSLLGVIVPGLFSIYGVLFMRSFFLNTPKEIAEAARIDGAGELRIFFTLYLRMVLPGLITLGLFTFNGNWNSYLWPKIILRRKADYVLAITVREFQALIPQTDYGTIMAAALVTILPTVLLFLIGQKYFMDNLSFTGIK